MQMSIDIYFKDTLKDSIVDLLLEDGYDDFFYIRCSKYASSSLLQSAAEQVSGRQEYGLFKIVLSYNEAEAVIGKILHTFGREDVRIYTNEIKAW